jgi:hypothetical protein
MAIHLLQRIGGLLNRREWYELPNFFAAFRLVEMRNELREKNLHDTEEPALQPAGPAAPGDPPRDERTIDGTFNDLGFPKMGSAGCRFGRNFPLEHVFPHVPTLLVPNPRLVSRELMTRDRFRPAEGLNLLAAAWIQFMVHDWFVHARSKDEAIEIPTTPGDDWGAPSISVPRSVASPAPAGSRRPPAYANLNSHWWDASQIYGGNAATAAALRTGIGGRQRIEPTGLLPVDPDTGLHFTGFTDNWWIGLAMLHTLFTLEHNHICDLLASQHPDWSDDKLFGKARLINAALMARIHTVEWTIAILAHPLIERAMNVIWTGLAGPDREDLVDFIEDREFLGGIVGSNADHFAAPYSLTEEFVSVYRMHPLMPDSFALHSLATGRHLETLELPEVAGRRTPSVTERVTMPDLFYSFGTSHPGAITLHNYPRHLQNITFENNQRLDLAAVDILRDRERGVPRYNQFRRLLRKDPVRSFDEITDDPAWRKQIKTVYNGDLEQVDLLTGLYAEPCPPGFGFSETAFRIFLLMAGRRLKSDRFYTDDWGAEVYTEFGLDYVKRNSMLTVLQRHYPQLAPAMSGKTNAFHPWNPVTAPVQPT